MTTATWGLILTVAAMVAIGLQFRRWRAARITGTQFAAGMVARAGFLVLGVLYASDLVYRWPRAPMLGLGIVGIGILLNLAVGVIENIRHARAPRDTGEDRDSR